MTSEADATTHLEDLLRAGLPIPPGDYWCPDGLVVPGDYPARAGQAGREPDPVKRGFWLADDLDRPPRVRWRYGWASLCGYIAVNPPGKLSALRPDGVVGFGVDGVNLVAVDNCAHLLIGDFDAGWAEGYGPGARDETVPAPQFLPAYCENGHETWPWLYSQNPGSDTTLAKDEQAGTCLCGGTRWYRAGTYRPGSGGMVKRREG